MAATKKDLELWAKLAASGRYELTDPDRSTKPVSPGSIDALTSLVEEPDAPKIDPDEDIVGRLTGWVSSVALPDAQQAAEEGIRGVGALGGHVLRTMMSANNPLLGPAAAGRAYWEAAEPTMASLAELTTGVADETRRRLFDGPDTDRARQVRHLGRTIAHKASHPIETFRAQPVHTLMDVSMLLAPMLRGVGMAAQASRYAPYAQGFTKAAQMVDQLNPIGVAGAAAGGAYNTTKRILGGTGKLGAEVWGLTSGWSSRPVRDTHRAQLLGGKEAELWEKQYTRALPTEAVAKAARDHFDGVKKQRGAEIDLAKQNWQFHPGQAVDVDKLKARLFAVAANPEYNVKRRVRYTRGALQPTHTWDLENSRLASAEQKAAVANMIKTIDRWPTRKKSPQELHDLRMRLDSDYHSSPAVLGNPYGHSNRLNIALKKVITDELTTKVKGFKEANAQFKAATDHLEELDAYLALGSTEINHEVILERLLGSLSPDLAKDVRRRVIAEAENFPGALPIRSQLAGMVMSQWLPRGLFGAGQMMGAVRGVGGALLAGGAMTGTLPWYSILAFPFSSPKLMGQFVRTLGYGQRQAQRAERFAQDVFNRLPPGAVTEGLSLASIIDRYLGLVPPAPQDVAPDTTGTTR